MVVSLTSLVHDNPKLSSFEFLQRTEDAFRALHQRITYLEERQAYGPSDEQVERVLRKILAERFADHGPHRASVSALIKSSDMEDARNRSTILPITIDAASLFVEPDSVPSKAYAETFHMLEGRLAEYPRMCSSEPDDENGNVKIEHDRSSI